MLEFRLASTSKDIDKVYNFDIEAFNDSLDFEWTVEDIKKELKEGWEMYAAVSGDEEIVAALFCKSEDNILHTKSTSIKRGFQGSGFSHDIKKFFEDVASDKGLKSIYHYCQVDNFRVYTLNENLGYKKIGVLENDEKIVVWEKKIK